MLKVRISRIRASLLHPHFAAGDSGRRRPLAMVFTVVSVAAAFHHATHAQGDAAGASAPRSDSVAVKVALLEEAYAQGNFDLAMSLTESIKDTLSYERHTKQALPRPHVDADQCAPTADLPEPWARWSAGWSHYKTIKLIETAGINRVGEPVDLVMSFPADQVSDLNREVRVAQVDGETGELREVISQVYDAARRGKRRTCHVVFQADVAANRAGHYLVLYGNPEAELPNYNTDLNVRGEGFGLDIENRHFIAHLSRQMGQMDRLTYKREHGLELFAGGKGHGEPPGIDWAHDYVDHGGFQKLRMRAWADCPNFEIVRGPLCVRVRRWGFPHSPIHPLFTPSRVHMDQAYVFYAGLPYFFKQGRIDMIQDVEISAMRDDEWVISGYSFTDQLWIDREGKVHEGAVPGSQSDDLWGVGYYHADSRDAFVALRLDHSAEGFAELAHGGVPMLHYAGHGLVWSRYPANQAELDAGDAILQTNAYTVFPYPEEGGAVQLEQLRRELLHPLRTEVGTAPTVAPAASEATLARPGETPADAPLKRKLWQALREVKDEQLYTIDANIVDLGYVYDLKVRNGTVNVLVTMPHRGRPVFNFLVFQGGGRVQEGIYERLMKVPTVRDVLVEFAWHPAWDASRLTPAGRKSLGLEDF